MRQLNETQRATPSAIELIIGIAIVGLGILVLVQVSIIALAQLRAESIARQGARAAALSASEEALESSLRQSENGNVFELDDWRLLEGEESVELFVTGSAYSIVLFKIDVSASSKIGVVR